MLSDFLSFLGFTYEFNNTSRAYKIYEYPELNKNIKESYITNPLILKKFGSELEADQETLNYYIDKYKDIPKHEECTFEFEEVSKPLLYCSGDSIGYCSNIADSRVILKDKIIKGKETKQDEYFIKVICEDSKPVAIVDIYYYNGFFIPHTFVDKLKFIKDRFGFTGLSKTTSNISISPTGSIGLTLPNV